jgi:hypothetical protein
MGTETTTAARSFTGVSLSAASIQNFPAGSSWYPLSIESPAVLNALDTGLFDEGTNSSGIYYGS